MKKKFDLLRSKNFKFSQIERNSINYGDFFLKLTISVKGGHSDYSPPGAKEPGYATV
jgi:hypothetical protein